MPTEADEPAPAIQLEGVTVRYHVPREAVASLKEYAIRRLAGRVGHDEFVGLSEVDLSIRPGEVVGLVGVNGSGKTPLAHLLCGLYRPQSGRVLIGGPPGT